MITPFSINGHRLTSLKGEVSSFYKVILSDLETLNDFDLNLIYKSLEVDLLKVEGSFRIYYKDQALYLILKDDQRFSSFKMELYNHPLRAYELSIDDTVYFYEDYALCNQSYIRLLSVQEFKKQNKNAAFQNNFEFVLNIKKIDESRAKRTLELKRKMHFSSFFKGIKDIEGESSYHEAENLLQDLLNLEKGLFDVEMFYVIRAENKFMLDEKTRSLVQEFELSDGKLRVESRGLSYFFNSTIPGVSSSFKRSHAVPSDYLVSLIPLHKDNLMDEGCGFTTRSGKTVFFNLFDRSSFNFNALITGSSGQGKSVLANKLIQHEIHSGSKVIILDLGNSFSKTVEYYKGVTLSSKFNPLQFKDPRYLKEFVVSVMDEKLSKKEEGRLFDIIQNNMGDISSVSGLVKLLDNHFKGLSYYFSEIMEFFDESNFSQNKLIYVDFSNYPEAVKAPFIIYLIECFKNLNGRKVFVFDECWNLLQKNADYIAECFRTFRKHEASAIAISQSLEDFSESQLGRVIIQNTFYKCLFRQKIISKSFKISDFESEILESIHSQKGEYSEFLLLSDMIMKPLRCFLNPLEFTLFNTDKEFNTKLISYVDDHKNYFSYQDLIKNFTHKKYGGNYDEASY